MGSSDVIGFLAKKWQIGAQRQNPQRRQIERVIHPQVERLRRDVARRSRRAAAARSGLVAIHHLEKVGRRTKQVVAGVVILILGGCGLRLSAEGRSSNAAKRQTPISVRAVMAAESPGGWGHPRQGDPYFRSLIRFAIKTDLAAQAIRDDRVDDMQAQTSATQIAPRRKERIEGLLPDIDAHATAVVREANFDVLLTRRTHLDADVASLPVGKPMRHRIEKEVAQHLSIGSG